MQRLEIPIQSDIGETIKIPISNPMRYPTYLIITTAGGSVIRASLDPMGEVSVTTGRDSQQTGVDIIFEDMLNDGLHLVKKDR